MQRRIRYLLITGILVICFANGFLYAFFAPFLLPIFFTLPLALLVLLIWALPDMRHPPIGIMEKFFFATLATMVVWPNYLAIALPGLPWITVARLTGFPFAFFLVLVASTSQNFRRCVTASLSATPIAPRLLIAFTAMEIMSLLVSNNKSESAQKLIVALVYWAAPFFAATFLFIQQGRALIFSRILWAASILVSGIALIEYKVGHVLWADHIPSFLQINDENVKRVLMGGGRAFTNKYRAKATFTTSLGLAEYLALTTPFVVHHCLNGKTIAMRIAAGLSVPFILLAILASGSRLGMVGFGLAVAIYGLVWAIFHRRLYPGNIIANAIIFASPILSAGGLIAIYFIGSLHKIFLGGGAANASNQARIMQWHMGFPLILRNPFGYGIGRGAETLGYIDPSGLLTIDSYYLLIVLEFGVIGFIIYYGLIAVSIAEGFRWGIGLPNQDAEESLLIPCSIALLAFMVIKAVFSNTENHSIAFIIMGMICALAYRSKRRLGVASVTGDFLNQ